MECGKPPVSVVLNSTLALNIIEESSQSHLIQHKFYYNLIQAEALVIPGDEIKNDNS